jgi:hypothetical protein
MSVAAAPGEYPLSSVARDPIAVSRSPGGPAGHLRECHGIEDHHLVARDVDQPFLMKLVEVARHNLAH